MTKLNACDYIETITDNKQIKGKKGIKAANKMKPR